MYKRKSLFFFLLATTTLLLSCNGSIKKSPKVEKEDYGKIDPSVYKKTPKGLLDSVLTAPIFTGAEQLEMYLPMLDSQRVALVVNQTSVIGDSSVVDVLLERGVAIEKIFAPEHGFRGTSDAGAKIDDGKDPDTGLPIISLYGNHKKPTRSDMDSIDALIFDIQDVGARFYTYISTMHYVMEACAENGVRFIVLDRPNPNGHYVDGPVLQKSHQSFVGMHPVPVVHGMTVGEYARMINGEGWLADKRKVNLKVIPCQNYNHKKSYTLPIKPSPNLPNDRSIYLYPSLCFFEGTVVSIGRGTHTQFQVIGHPDFQNGNYSFTPKPLPGATKPKLEGQLCKGFDYSTYPVLSELREETKQLKIEWLIDFYNQLGIDKDFFLKNGFFDKLAGNDDLRKQIVRGKSANEIRASWQEDLQSFRQIRKKYLLYEDF